MTTLVAAFSGTTSARTHLVRSSTPAPAPAKPSDPTYDAHVVTVCGKEFDGFTWEAHSPDSIDCKVCAKTAATLTRLNLT